MAVLSRDAEKVREVLTEMAGNVRGIVMPSASHDLVTLRLAWELFGLMGASFSMVAALAVSIPCIKLMIKNLEIHGKYMYEPEHTKKPVKTVEAGLLLLGKKVNFNTTGRFKLDHIQEALELTEKDQARVGRSS
ncbi:hypothetical protein BKA56DRAFT_677738 [Ilyonectria sp. MPI-CAGE-AT-0026]|nr:hypothetical protein BKA56DRAFT_677738 [Ilyonectria sp. MPI-CAGE-AT-0026]